ncbi:UNVERIFIED_CONTAM: Peroxisomal nicotinamide adenine dinucleotide carrier [Sesamum latifolium]|uniref:Peroxisomal nicotinamide adenine dinucleotide carrier n=1 Tax=Sesamum latifolium TaxID=2727402 RepID=A0AAW2XIW1_9LAMI
MTFTYKLLDFCRSLNALLTNPNMGGCDSHAAVKFETESDACQSQYVAPASAVDTVSAPMLLTRTKKSQPNITGSLSSEEIIHTAVEPPPYSTSHAIQEVYDEAGVLGFWKGVFPTLIMVSNPSIQFMLYETFLKMLKKRRFSSSKGNSNATALEIFLLGALAKLGATVVTYPLIVLKSRLQAKQITGGDKRYQYTGTLDAVLKMIRYEGFYSFYKGMGAKIVQSVLAAAVLSMVKEELVRGSRWLLTKAPVDSVKPKTPVT